jgi:predicted RNA-binding Zn ribbon-like protein
MVDVADLPLVGGHPALDLVNTLERGAPIPGTTPRDFIPDAAEALAWAQRSGLLSPDEAVTVLRRWRREPSAARASIEALGEIREALHIALLAAVGSGDWSDVATRSALALMHRRWLEAVARSEVVHPPEGVPGVVLRVGTEPAWLVSDRAAEAALDVLRSADMARLRRCPVESGGCGWMFLDQSRNGSRRWCRMADCGTAVKSRRLTERRRELRKTTSQLDDRA